HFADVLQQRKRQRSRWRCGGPHSGAARWRPTSVRLLESGDVDLYAELYIRLSEVARGEQTVEFRCDVGRPGVVDRVPVPSLGKRRTKMIVESHGGGPQRRGMIVTPLGNSI